jgi:hypothetical protein
MHRKQIKIEAKQALETWEQRLQLINQWEEEEVPQSKLDEFVNLAIHSSGDINDVLQRVGNWMDGNPSQGDFIELREDLSTALKETINFRLHYSDYTHHQLFKDIGNIDELIDVKDLFADDEVVESNLFDQPADTNEVEDRLIENLDSPKIKVELTEQAEGKQQLDDFLFDVEE